MKMTFQETKEYIRHDFYRNLESCTRRDICKAFFLKILRQAYCYIIGYAIIGQDVPKEPRFSFCAIAIAI